MKNYIGLFISIIIIGGILFYYISKFLIFFIIFLIAFFAYIFSQSDNSSTNKPQNSGKNPNNTNYQQNTTDCRNKNKPHNKSFKINCLWHSQNEQDWEKALDDYYNLVKPQNMMLEKELDNLDFHTVKNMNAKQFYNFLHDKYFVWKYTAPNRLATTRKNLEKYINENNLSELEEIHKLIFEYDLEDIQNCLKNVRGIKGLGIAGASGLLSLLFPKYFGTVDQFVVYRLLELENLDKHSFLLKMKPESLTLKDGVILIEIMKNKANELNTLFQTDKWTPRKIDKILWSIDR